MQNDSQNISLALTPLGAGDLIDRAIRFYRNNFWTFIWIAAPPILIGTLISIGWTVLGRELFSIGTGRTPDAYIISALFNWVGKFIIWFFEGIAILIVMGGASRNFVRHILFGEPITFRETYHNVRKRIGGLVIASTLMAILFSTFGMVIFYIGAIVLGVVVFIITFAFVSVPFVGIVIGIILGIGLTFGTGWLFFLIASRFAYIPQVMLVEGQGIFSAVGRSTNLAGGNVNRLYALFIFTMLATYAALLLFYIPLGWYAYLNGIQIVQYDPDTVPAWYVIVSQVIGQASWILSTPVLMIGLCLLYVDDRVRSEGYDIELIAARRLGEIPPLPREFMNPLQPALAQNLVIQPQAAAERKSSITTLGLK